MGLKYKFYLGIWTVSMKVQAWAYRKLMKGAWEHLSKIYIKPYKEKECYTERK